MRDDKYYARKKARTQLEENKRILAGLPAQVVQKVFKRRETYQQLVALEQQDQARQQASISQAVRQAIKATKDKGELKPEEQEALAKAGLIEKVECVPTPFLVGETDGRRDVDGQDPSSQCGEREAAQ